MTISLEYVPEEHPINKVNHEMLAKLVKAQKALVDRQYPDFAALADVVCRKHDLDPGFCSIYADQKASEVGTMKRRRLLEELTPKAKEHGMSITSLSMFIDDLHLLWAFEEPNGALELVRKRIESVLEGFPREALDIERGNNAGDLLDPFIMAATKELLYDGSLDGAIEATVSHKALMMIEGLIGHLHEDVLGMFRGNVRVPEPRGEDKEKIDPKFNPFPGADVVQPPWGPDIPVRFHQIKCKMGSAKGGDGKRLGQQLKLLGETYEASTYYDALIGRSLAGHRSMAAVLKQSPSTVVLVGQATMIHLTNGIIGGEVMLRLYQGVFREVAHATGYSVIDISKAISHEFRTRVGENEEEFLPGLLYDVTSGVISDQDSRTYRRNGRSR